MTVSRTIYTTFATETTEFDINQFILSVLLFDSVLVSNPEIIPNLVQAIGLSGVIRLVEEGRLSVVGGGPTAQANYDYRYPGFFENRPIHRPLRFGFETIFVDPQSPRNHSVEERLLIDLKKEKDGFSLDESTAKELFDHLLPSIKVINGNSLNYGDEIRDDILNKQKLVVDLFLSGLARVHNIPVYVMNMELSVEEVADHIFQVNTNLGKLLNISVEETHNYLKKPFFEITGTNLQILRMKAVDAASGLTEAQSKITAKRIDFISKVLIEADSRPDFTRICKVTNTPELPVGNTINVDQLIELRESPEAYAFRDWLQNSQQYTDKEIEEITSNWKRKIGEVLNSQNAKGIR